MGIKVTVSMLVSKPPEFFRRAMYSILVSQWPDEVLLLYDPELSWDLEEEASTYSGAVDIKLVPQEPAKIKNLGRFNILYPDLDPDFVLRKWKHTEDLVIRAVLKASNTWVRMCDDDDEMLCDIRGMIKKANGSTGIINGDFIFSDPAKNRTEHRKGYKIIGKSAHALGSTNCFRKKAVAQAAEYWEPGPWPDWQLTYLMWRLGWKNLYAPEVFSIQHWNESSSSRRRSGYISWEALERNLSTWWRVYR